MNMETFEERRVDRDELENAELMREGQAVKLLKFRDKIIGVELPDVVELKVTAVEDSAAGNFALLESGGRIKVPAIVKEGNVIRINTSERAYVERA